MAGQTGLFSFIDSMLDSAEEVITETPKTVKEKLPELAGAVGNASLAAGQKVIKSIGEYAGKTCSNDSFGNICTGIARYLKSSRRK